MREQFVRALRIFTSTTVLDGSCVTAGRKVVRSSPTLGTLWLTCRSPESLEVGASRSTMRLCGNWRVAAWTPQWQSTWDKISDSYPYHR